MENDGDCLGALFRVVCSKIIFVAAKYDNSWMVCRSLRPFKCNANRYDMRWPLHIMWYMRATHVFGAWTRIRTIRSQIHLSAMAKLRKFISKQQPTKTAHSELANGDRLGNCAILCATLLDDSQQITVKMALRFIHFFRLFHAFFEAVSWPSPSICCTKTPISDLKMVGTKSRTMEELQSMPPPPSSQYLDTNILP